MGIALIWIEALAAALLLVATAAALAARIRRPRIRVALVIAAWLVPFAPAVAATVLAGSLQFHSRISPGRFGYTLSWTLAFAIAGVIVARKGLRRGADPATGWPAERLAIAFGAAAALLLMTFWNVDLAMRQQLVALRSEASAIALASLPGPVPDAENAAFEYRKAFEGLRAPFVRLRGEVDLDDLLRGDSGRLDAVDGETLAKLASWARAQEPTFALLRRAASLPRCDFGHDPAGRLLAESPPKTVGMRQACDAVAIAALVDTRHGRMGEAIDDIRLFLRMGEHLRDDPSIISLLLSARLDGLALHALGRIIGREELDPAALAAIPFGEADAYRRALLRALRMEKAFHLQVFALTDGSSPPWTLGGHRDSDGIAAEILAPLLATAQKDILAPLYRVFLLTEDLETIRERIDKAIDLAPLPYWRTVEAWSQITGHGVERGGLLTSMIFPSLIHASLQTARAEARREVARAAVAVVRYRAERGSAPQKIEDTVPEFLPAVPQDPFDGKPLRMIARDGGLVIYSVGSDLRDDGGTSRQEGAGEDIAIRIE
ncbi:MAG: hypothetical protein JXP34_26990 [Planctomycetes bacterium]|nr:hypothetical protein [Planctomycetota bacterium]